MRIYAFIFSNVLAVVSGYLCHNVYCETGIWTAISFAFLAIVAITAVYIQLEIAIDMKKKL